MSITLDQVRAEALFAGELQPSEHPPPARVRRSVTAMLRQYGSVWCAARMAEEYGDHPEAAAARMAWALQVVHDCFDPDARRRTRCRPFGTSIVSRPEPAGRGRCRYPTGRYRHVVERGDRWC